jgi:hypothetical protein
MLEGISPEDPRSFQRTIVQVLAKVAAFRRARSRLGIPMLLCLGMAATIATERAHKIDVVNGAARTISEELLQPWDASRTVC